MPLESKWAQAAASLPPQPLADDKTVKKIEEMIHDLDAPTKSEDFPKQSHNHKQHNSPKQPKQTSDLKSSKWAQVDSQNPGSNGTSNMNTSFKAEVKEKDRSRPTHSERRHRRERRSNDELPLPKKEPVDIADSIRALQNKQQANKSKPPVMKVRPLASAQKSQNLSVKHSANLATSTSEITEKPKWEDFFDPTQEGSWADLDDFDYNHR